jgi:hypothetical protein
MDYILRCRCSQLFLVRARPRIVRVEGTKLAEIDMIITVTVSPHPTLISTSTAYAPMALTAVE